MYLINDVSTDISNPPPKGGEGGLMIKAYSTEHQKQLSKKYSDLRPIVVQVSVDQALAKIIKYIKKDSSMVQKSYDKQKQLIHAVSTTFLLRFKDDVVFRLEALTPKQTRIDIRSSSRVGRSDFDANYKRIKMIEKSLS